MWEFPPPPGMCGRGGKPGITDQYTESFTLPCFYAHFSCFPITPLPALLAPALETVPSTIVSIKACASYCYCAYVLRILGYSGFLRNLPPDTKIFLRGL